MKCVESFAREYEPAITVPEVKREEVAEKEPVVGEAFAFFPEALPWWFIVLLFVIILGAIAAFLHQRTAHGVIPAKKNISKVRKKYPEHVKKLDEYLKQAKLKGYSREHIEKSLTEKGKWNHSFVKEYLHAYWKK